MSFPRHNRLGSVRNLSSTENTVESISSVDTYGPARYLQDSFNLVWKRRFNTDNEQNGTSDHCLTSSKARRLKMSFCSSGVDLERGETTELTHQHEIYKHQTKRITARRGRYGKIQSSSVRREKKCAKVWKTRSTHNKTINLFFLITVSRSSPTSTWQACSNTFSTFFSLSLILPIFHALSSFFCRLPSRFVEGCCSSTPP